ncbi:glycosyltransferase family 4 protein [Flavobacterium sp.]|uniref:glycosyltransferase family 4 protein n=1 Tax=Flavobacterium sp. TaxID=239 RepID=UPI0028BF417D|nr:glycosyltransferase family 4 protein [Flavobacterium sp.]
MKVLYLTKYTRKGASSRLRSYQYFPFLEEKGFEIVVRPLFSDAYLDRLYAGESTFFEAIRCYIRRFFVLFSVFRFQKIVIEKELFPYFPAWFEQIFSWFGVSYIADYDDAVFHNYDNHPNKFIRQYLGDKIDKVMKSAKSVLAGNDYLAERARKSGAKHIVVLPTVIDVERYTVVKKVRSGRSIIGWIGSPSTFKYVKALFPMFEELYKKIDFELHIIGANYSEEVTFPIVYIPWSEATEVESIKNFDVGIMPLEDSNWEKGKCAYKLIQYMGCGIPVVASPVGMNVEVVKSGINGYLPETPEQWAKDLEILISDKSKSCTFGLAGKQLVDEKFTIQNRIAELVAILEYRDEKK